MSSNWVCFNFYTGVAEAWVSGGNSPTRFCMNRKENRRRSMARIDSRLLVFQPPHVWTFGCLCLVFFCEIKSGKIFHCVLCSKMMTGKFRAATGGKGGKTMVLTWFSGIVLGDGSGGTLLMWPPLWRSCLPKIFFGGPGKHHCCQRWRRGTAPT